MVSADRHGAVSRAGVGLRRKMAEYASLSEAVIGAVIDTYKDVPVHASGWVFADRAVAVTQGADVLSAVAVLGDRQDLFGPVP